MDGEKDVETSVVIQNMKNVEKKDGIQFNLNFCIFRDSVLFMLAILLRFFSLFFWLVHRFHTHTYPSIPISDEGILQRYATKLRLKLLPFLFFLSVFPAFRLIIDSKRPLTCVTLHTEFVPWYDIILLRARIEWKDSDKKLYVSIAII